MQTVGRQRPVGITIISIILWILGVLGLILAILGIVGLSATSNSAVAGALIVGLVIAAIIAIAEIVLGWGLWTLKPWAFWATVVVEVINVLSGLYSLLVAHNNTSLFNLILGIVILIYLFADRNVRAAFRT